MSFDEQAALEVAAVRAVETSDDAQTFWTDADRTWASQAAAVTVGEGATPEAFLAARARLALQRIDERFKAYSRAVRALRWRPWVGVAITAVALAAGVAIDQVGGSQRINLLAPPLFGLLVWNVAVYALLAASAFARPGDAPRHPLRALVARFAGGVSRGGRGAVAAAAARFAGDWTRLSAPLYYARAARILHFAAATFAVGLVAGLYLRGIAFEYRASWESTFLGATTVRALLAFALAPGAALTGIALPSAAEVEAIRAPGGENAAHWLHLMAATIAAIVIMPRLLLALSMWLIERHRRARLPIALDEAYFARLLRGMQGGALRVRVVPYSYTMPASAAGGLERLLRRVFGESAALTIAAPVAYGAEDALAASPGVEHSTNVIAVFNAAATPEPAAHGAFLDALAAQLAPGGTLIALIDEGSLRERWANDGERLEARRASWRSICGDHRIGCLFAVLARPDVGDAVADLERALEGVGAHR